MIIIGKSLMSGSGTKKRRQKNRPLPSRKLSMKMTRTMTRNSTKTMLSQPVLERALTPKRMLTMMPMASQKGSVADVGAVVVDADAVVVTKRQKLRNRVILPRLMSPVTWMMT